MNSSGDILMCVVPSAPRALQLQHDVTRAIALEPLKGERRAGDGAAQAFEFLVELNR